MVIALFGRWGWMVGLNRKYRVIHDIPGEQRSLVLERLQPATEYQLYLVAFALSGQPTNISGKVHFVSPDATQNDSWIQKGDPSQLEEETPAPFTVREEEVVIVVLVLAVWVFVIVLFFNKWGKIRMLEPYQPQYHSHPVIPSRLPLNDALAPLERFNLEFGAANTPYHLHKMRPRQNSVFVGSPYRSRSGSMLSEPRMPRKHKKKEFCKSRFFSRSVLWLGNKHRQPILDPADIRSVRCPFKLNYQEGIRHTGIYLDQLRLLRVVTYSTSSSPSRRETNSYHTVHSSSKNE
ncbi:unnamed protein product, partial [Larinioides sclopetarius]